MSQRLRTKNGSTNLPGAYSSLTVLNTIANFPGAGILCLIGEADAGPDFSLEADLTQNFFTPDQFSAFRQKYISGRGVDAMYASCSPSQDPKLDGAPQAIYFIKTNVSDKASAALPKIGGGTYHTLADKNWGDYGNLISYASTVAQAEVRPTTGTFSLLVPNNTTDITFRANGGAALAYQLSAADLPPTTVSGINALSGIVCTGGANRGIVVVAGTLAVAVSGNQITVTRSVAWTVAPTIGDSLYIPSGSAIQGGSNENRGSYVITAVTSTTLVATKLLDASGAAGAVTPPAAVSATAIAAITDIMAFAPVTITIDAADPIAGTGKALEVNELTSSTGRFTDLAYQLNTDKVTWIATSSAPTLLTSSAEYQVSLMDARSLDGVSEYSLTTAGSQVLGGNVVLSIGYEGTTATCTITSTALTTSVTGGSGANLNLAFKRFVTIADLVTYINAQAGYSATVLLPQYGPKAPGSYKSGIEGYLDQVTAIGICTSFGNEPGRIKADAREYFNAVQGTLLVQLGTTTAANIPAAAGLPDVASGYLSGGAKGGTTAARFGAAIDAAESLNFNFGCLLIAQDASADVSDSETESSSTYVLEDVITYARTQAERLSTQFERKPRQYFAGVMGSYVTVQRPLCIRQSTKGRVSLCIEDVLAVGPDDTSHQYQPWYAAVLAAAMQAAAFTGGILHREPRQNGVIHRVGDFNPNNRGDVQGALDSGILLMSRGAANPTAVGSQGRWTWTSDQTAYIRDNNFYFNSIQAIFLGDLLQLLVALAAEDAIVGDRSSDADAALVKKTIEKLLGDMLKAGILVADDESPRGFKQVNVTQEGPTYFISVEKCKLNTLIYFLAIDFSIAPITRSA